MKTKPNPRKSRAKDIIPSKEIVEIHQERAENEENLHKTRMATKQKSISQREEPWIEIGDKFKANYSLEDLPELLKAMKSRGKNNHLLAAQGFRKLLNINPNPPIQDIIDAGVILYLIDWIQKFDFPQLQQESAWAIMNISLGGHHQCKIIVEKGCIPFIIQMLNSTNEKVLEQAVWTLGNLGADSAYCRDMILQSQGLPSLINFFKKATKDSDADIAIWAISNLCRSEPLPLYEIIKDAMPILAESVKNQKNQKILIDCLWALSHLSEGSEEKVDDLITTGVVPIIMQLLSHRLSKIHLPAIRIIGNVAYGNENQAQLIFNLGGAEKLCSLLTSAKNAAKREIVWCISNMCSGNIQQLDRLLDANIIPLLITCTNHSNIKIKQELVWVYYNIVVRHNFHRIMRCVEGGILQSLFSLIGTRNVDIKRKALETLIEILKLGKENSTQIRNLNEFANSLEEGIRHSSFRRLFSN